MKLHARLLIALVAGAALGFALHSQAGTGWLAWTSLNILGPIGQLFLRAIFMIVVPMVFSALVIGVCELGKGHDLKGVAGRTLLFTVLLSTCSVTLGLVMTNVIRPGDRIDRSVVPAQSVEALEATVAATKPLRQTIVELVPRNPLDSAVRALDGEMLALMVFALAFGMAVSAAALASRDGAATPNVLITFLEQVFDACMRIVHFVMRFAPIAVFAIIFNTTLTFGTSVFVALALYVITVVGALLIHQFVIYSAFLWGMAGRSPMEFFRQAREAEGFDVDLANMVAKALGVKLEMQQVTGANRIPFLLTDKVDIVISVMGLTPERAKQVMFTAPYADTQLAVFGPKNIAVKSADQLGSNKVAAAKGTTQELEIGRAHV